MKRIICLLLSIILMCSSLNVFAKENEKYVTASVEYSDNIGNLEQLELMIKDNNIYVNAEIIANRLGYDFKYNAEMITIYNIEDNDIPYVITNFFINDTKVSQSIFFQMIDSYEAPFKSVKNNKGYWVPFEYSLIILNSGILILEDTILIDIPSKDIIDYCFDAQRNGNKYRFDWNKDFGYTEVDWKVIGTASHITNIFNGVLDFEMDSWLAMFQSAAMDSSVYDKKYGENLALLLCSQSQGELNSTIDNMELYQNLFLEGGQLNEILSEYSINLDNEVGQLYEECEKILKRVNEGNSSTLNYNKTYQALEKAFDKQTWFSNTGGNIINVQKNLLSEVSTIFDIGIKVSEFVGYRNEFMNQDKFSLSALMNYLDKSQNVEIMSEDIKQSMIEYSDALSGNMNEFMLKRFYDNVDKWIINNIPIGKELGTQANAVLFCLEYSIYVIPFISNGIESADNFELALYGQVFQADTLFNYENIRNSILSDIDNNLNPEKLYEFSQYCYIYLKSCYISRDAAIASLSGKSVSVKEKIKPLIDYQNDINNDISKIMNKLKTANKTNEENVYGFLPYDNKVYLQNFDNSSLILMVEDFKNIVLGSWTNAKEGYVDKYITTFNKDGTIIQEGYRNKDIGFYKIIDENIIKATFNDNMLYPSQFGEYKKINNYIYTVTYTYNSDNNTLYADYSKEFEENISSNANDGILYRDKKYSDENNIFGFIPEKFIFTSGAGGSVTEIILNDDGTFIGKYYNSEFGDVGIKYPDGTVHISNFSGKFTTPKQVNEYTYSMQLKYLNSEGTVGDEYYENNLRYVISEPYGFDNADEFLIYLSGIAISDLPEGFINWLYSFLDVQTTEILPYYGIYNVEGEKGFIAYDIDMNEEDSDTTVKSDDEWRKAYKSILLQHPVSTPFTFGSNTSYINTEYMIYDIDKNGIPELIVRENISDYYIYSFNGTDIVISDKCYWSYADCLYEYEENGIVVHDGGIGSMRIEYASLYSMVNNKLEYIESLISTEEYSVDELYSFLYSLTPINDFHPITEDSYLSD